MTDLTLVIKGDKHQAVLAAKMRGIPLTCKDECDEPGDNVTGTAPASFRDKISTWLGEGGDLVSFTPALAHYEVNMSLPQYSNMRRQIKIPAKDSHDARKLANKMHPNWRAIDAELKHAKTHE